VYGQRSVLYVEDDAYSRKIMKLLLDQRMKIPKIKIFEDSTNFVNRVNQLGYIPDVIFLDIHVYPIDGFEMLRLVRGLPQFKQSQIIALTASVMNNEVHQLKTAGFDGCLAKPIDLPTFPNTFARILSGETIWRITE